MTVGTMTVMAKIGPTQKLVMDAIIRIRIKVHLFACARVFVCMLSFESAIPTNHRRYWYVLLIGS